MNNFMSTNKTVWVKDNCLETHYKIDSKINRKLKELITIKIWLEIKHSPTERSADPNA